MTIKWAKRFICTNEWVYLSYIFPFYSICIFKASLGHYIYFGALMDAEMRQQNDRKLSAELDKRIKMAKALVHRTYIGPVDIWGQITATEWCFDICGNYIIYKFWCAIKCNLCADERRSRWRSDILEVWKFNSKHFQSHQIYWCWNAQTDQT